MNKKIKPIIIYVLLATTTFLSVFFFQRTVKLKKELESYRAVSQLEEVDNQPTLYQQIFTIDSLLINGRYGNAKVAYEQFLKEYHIEDPFRDAIQSRINHVSKMANMQEKLRLFEGEEPYQELSEKLNEKSHQIDSLSKKLAVTVRTTQDQFDSLNFALEKANMRSQSLSSQLATKSNHDFLKFTNSKEAEVYYVGETEEHRANGRGVGVYSTGSRYEGEWKDNVRHGEGVFYWPDGEYYSGNFENDQRHGYGNYYWPNGEWFSGEWENDQRNGEGIFYGKDGKIVVTGMWENNKLVERSK